MEINVQFVKMNTSETMETYVRNKMGKLAKKYDWVLQANVFFRKENDPKGKGKICEAQLILKGRPKIFASSSEKNFEMAVKETLNDLEKQLEKRKNEMRPHM